MTIRLLLLGATGAVGSEVLRQALDSPAIQQVGAPTRRPLGLRHAKLNNPVTDFSSVSADTDWLQCDAVVCALGTTIRIAGSQAAFAAVDRDLPITLGQLARAAGARRYSLNSSLGARAGGNFYLRTKWEAEQGIIGLGFDSVTIVRPSLIDATRAQRRPAEHLGIIAARLLRPLIPSQYRSVTPAQIARALLDGAISGQAGTHLIESSALTG